MRYLKVDHEYYVGMCLRVLYDHGVKTASVTTAQRGDYDIEFTVAVDVDMDEEQFAEIERAYVKERYLEEELEGV